MVLVLLPPSAESIFSNRNHRKHFLNYSLPNDKNHWLTGGIGSGKSTIASYFKSLGIPVYIADDASRNVTALPKVRKQIKINSGQTFLTVVD
jgi:ABC-type bacteriocin/lantibiotic exporter with double-glycine peptidase domain